MIVMTTARASPSSPSHMGIPRLSGEGRWLLGELPPENIDIFASLLKRLAICYLRLWALSNLGCIIEVGDEGASHSGARPPAL